jgi:hypothetical protein
LRRLLGFPGVLDGDLDGSRAPGPKGNTEGRGASRECAARQAHVCFGRPARGPRGWR